MQSEKLRPNLDQESTKLLNLTVLQRNDPFIEDILFTAAHVTFYEFNIDLNQWARKDVEGSLFVVKRNAQPRFQFIVMNRRNTDNLVENLLGDFEYEVQAPYLLYQNASHEVNGIWFYNPDELEEVASLFNRIINAYSKVSPQPNACLNKSCSEYEELEAVPTMMESAPEPSLAESTATGVPEDPSFMNFFAAALNIGNTASNTVNLSYTQSSHVPVPCHYPAPAPQLPLYPPSASYPPPVPLHDSANSVSSNNLVADLVKPSSFFTPAPSSSASVASPPMSSSLSSVAPHPPLNLKRPSSTPILQPFSSHTTAPSLNPTYTPTANYGPLINKDKVRDALSILVQDNQFIDLFYQTLLKAHHS